MLPPVNQFLQAKQTNESILKIFATQSLMYTETSI